MKFIILLTAIMLHADTTTRDISEYINIRTYESENYIEYSSRVVLYKGEVYRLVFILRQKYDILNDKTVSNYMLLKASYYF